nr:MAG TPA: hypothetical protein [Caudoviricetes sp.]
MFARIGPALSVLFRIGDLWSPLPHFSVFDKNCIGSI